MEATHFDSRPSFPAVKLIAGIFFIVLGLVLAADNLQLLDAEAVLRFWPVVLIVIGAVKLAGHGGSRAAGIAFLLAGAWILAYDFGWIDLTLFDLWPLLLIGLGISTVVRALGIRGDGQGGGTGSPALALFASRRVTVTSPDFRRAGAYAVLGGHQLDLTGAGIAESPAVVDTFAFWGGVEILVPDDWEVVGEVTPVMAGFVVKTRPAADPAKRLIVRGAALMGGIEVKNASRRDA